MINLRDSMKFKKRGGFTFIEVLVALAITGLIAGTISMATIQLVNVNDQNVNSITAQRQVQQVGFYMSRDAQNAQGPVSMGTGTSPAGTGFDVVFSWTTWGDIANPQQSISVRYKLSGTGIVTRTVSINGAEGTPQQIASFINILQANTKFSGGSGYYTLKITATVPGKNTVSKTRTYQIDVRSAS